MNCISKTVYYQTIPDTLCFANTVCSVKLNFNIFCTNNYLCAHLLTWWAPLVEHLTSPSVFSGVRVVQSLVFSVVFCGFFCPFSFGHCVVCPPWLLITSLWYLQACFSYNRVNIANMQQGHMNINFVLRNVKLTYFTSFTDFHFFGEILSIQNAVNRSFFVFFKTIGLKS
jgi:hypothetical protein